MSVKQSANEEVVVNFVGSKESNEAKGSQSSASEEISKVSSPEISISGSQKTPVVVSRRNSFNRSALSKPKSRFGELSDPIDSSTSLEPVDELNEGDNKSVSMDSHPPASVEEEDQYEEICKRNNLKRRSKHREAVRRALFGWIFFLCNLGCLVASLTVPKLENLVVWDVVIWKWCVLVLVISCGLLITSWLMSFIVYFIERSLIFSSYEMEEKVLFYVTGMKKSVEVVMWWGLVLLTWLLLFKRGIKRSKSSTKILGYITRTIVSVLIGALLWLLKTLLVRILKSKLEDIIGETKMHQEFILHTLLAEAYMVKDDEKAKKDIDMEKTQKMKQGKVNNILARTIKVLVDAVFRFAGMFTETRNEWDGPQDDRVEEAAAAARFIFRNIAQSGSEYIEEEDLLNLRFMDKEVVDLVFDLIEGADSRKRRIDRTSLTQWVVMVYTGRKALNHARDDTKAVVAQVDTLVTSIVIVISIVVLLILLEIATTNLLVLISSQLVLAAFAFGSTCKNVFESIMFLFVAHPFDVGDRVVLDGVPMTVEEMNIFNTAFLKANNEKVYYPNSVLSTKPISNYFRSPEMGDTVEFSIALPPVEKIVKLKQKVKEYFERNPRCWKPIHNVAVVDIEDVNKLKMAVNCHYTTNFQDLGRKNLRRAELKLELLKILEELNITCYSSQDGSLTQTKSDSTAS